MLAQALKLLQGLRRLGPYSADAAPVSERAVTRPNLVVSMNPNFNHALHDCLALARPGVPFVTVLTDMADHPSHFWIEPGLAQPVVCGTEHAAVRALLSPLPRLPQYQARVQAIHNRAVFEVPQILQRILQTAQLVQPPALLQGVAASAA